MALVKVKPTSPARRGMVKLVNPDLYKGRPFAGLLEKNPKVQVVTTMAILRPAILVEVTNSIIVSLTLFVTRMVLLQKWNVSSTIRTVRPILLWFVTQMVSVVTLSRPKGCLLAIRL